MIAKTEQDFEGLKKIGKIVAEIREALKEATIPGMTTKEIDEIGGLLFKKKEQFLHQLLNMISLGIHA